MYTFADKFEPKVFTLLYILQYKKENIQHFEKCVLKCSLVKIFFSRRYFKNNNGQPLTGGSKSDAAGSRLCLFTFKLLCGPHVTCALLFMAWYGNLHVSLLWGGMQNGYMPGWRYSKLILISAERRQMISFPFWQTQRAAGIVYLPRSLLDACHISWAMRCYYTSESRSQ